MKLKLLLTGLILMLGLFPAKASLQEPEKDNTEQSKAQKERPASPDVEEVGQVKPKGKVEASSRSEAAPQKSKSLQSARPNLERGEKGRVPILSVRRVPDGLPELVVPRGQDVPIALIVLADPIIQEEDKHLIQNIKPCLSFHARGYSCRPYCC